MASPVSQHESLPTPDPAVAVTPMAPSPGAASSQSAGDQSGQVTVPVTPPLLPPLPRRTRTTFGPYDILEEIAQGGMGVVYRVRHRTLGHVVALKVTRSGIQASPEEVERFFREARAVANLKHPHVIRIHDFGEFEGQYYFTMTLAEWGSLGMHMARLGGEPRAVVQVMEKVARAVQYVHEQGLLHRDLKPGNILLEKNDQPLVSDFGLARTLEPSDVDLTRSGEAPGTPAYMAPEQASGENDVCPQTDVWALGVILFEMLCGQKPFGGAGREKLTFDILMTEPPEPRSLQPKLDRSLEAVILKCLQKDPARRYTSAGALADDLGCWLRGEPTKARPPTWVGRLLRRHPRWLSALSALGLLGLGAAAFLHFTDPDRPLHARIVPELKRGNAVPLLGERGVPEWSRWLVPGAVTPVEDAPLSIHAGTLSLLELVPRPPLARYRFRAEVRHETSSIAGDVGIYFCRSSEKIARGDVHGFCALSFADCGANAVDSSKKPRGTLRLHFRYYSPPVEEKQHINGIQPTGINRSFVPYSATLKGTEWRKLAWRKLAVEVTPENIRIFWEGHPQPVGTLLNKSRLAAPEAMRMAYAELKGVSLNFPLQGGLGLLVNRSAASFRNVVIEPIED